MNLLASPWFFQLVEKQAGTPAARLVAVFRVIDTWISAPGIRTLLLQDGADGGYSVQVQAELKRFLRDLAAAARVREPEALANQLAILLQGAIAEEMRNSGSGALAEAAKAALAVVGQACAGTRRQRWLRLSGAGIAAGLLLAAGVLLPQVLHTPSQETNTLAQRDAATRLTVNLAAYSPDTLAEVLALQREIEQGHCPAPQLLAMPPGQVTAYMNAVNFRTPENPAADRENIHAFLVWFKQSRASECYFAPHNGHTSVTWSKS